MTANLPHTCVAFVRLASRPRIRRDYLPAAKYVGPTGWAATRKPQHTEHNGYGSHNCSAMRRAAPAHASGSRDREAASVLNMEPAEDLASDAAVIEVEEGERGTRGASGQVESTSAAELPDLAATVVSLSGNFLVFWCLAPFPGSVWAGVPLHDNFVHLIWQALPIDEIIGPESLMLKYNTLGNAPALLHALPGAVWCALAPMQLAGPGQGRSHVLGGRIMLASAAVLMVGYALIDGSGLTAEEFDFGGHGGRLAEIVDSSAIRSLMPLSFHKLGLKLVAGWFVWTGMKTATSAIGRDFEAHRAWAIRHLGAGLWVAAQRPLFSVYRLAQFALLGQGASSVATEQADAFYNSAYAVTLLYFLGSEAVARGSWAKAEPRK